MFEQYQFFIYLGAGLLFLTFLYIWLKKSSKKKVREQEIVNELAKLNESEKNTEIKEKVENLQTDKKEKSVDISELTPTIQTTPTPTKKGKIRKEDFKDFNGIKILLAEDNIINQKVVLSLLAGSGIDIKLANDGKEVLQILDKNTNFSLILMDAHMPNIDGFEATEIIKATPEYSHIPVIALSGDVSADDIKKMKKSGMVDHLEKPLHMGSLYNILYKYSQNDKNKKTEPKILNTNKGMNICGNDKDFYKEIINEFTSSYRNSAETLRKLLDEKKITLADSLLLDIIGVASNIGAERIHDIATEFKHELKTNNRESINKLLQEYSDAVEELLIAIKEFE